MASQIQILMEFISQVKGDRYAVHLSNIGVFPDSRITAWALSSAIDNSPISIRIQNLYSTIQWIRESIDVYEEQFKHISDIAPNIKQAIAEKFKHTHDFIHNRLSLRDDTIQLHHRYGDYIKLSINQLISETNAFLQATLIKLDLDTHRKQLEAVLKQLRPYWPHDLGAVENHLVRPLSHNEKLTLIVLLETIPDLVKIKDLHARVGILQEYVHRHQIIYDERYVQDAELSKWLQYPMTQDGRKHTQNDNTLKQIIPFGNLYSMWILYPSIVNLQYLNWSKVAQYLEHDHSFRQAMKHFYPYQLYRYVLTTDKEILEFKNYNKILSGSIYKYIQNGIDAEPDLMPGILSEFIDKLKMPKDLVKYLVYLSGRPRTDMNFVITSLQHPLPILQNVLATKGVGLYTHGTTAALFNENGMTFIEPKPDSAVLVNTLYLYKTIMLENSRGIFLPVLRFVKEVLGEHQKSEEKEKRPIETREKGLYQESTTSKLYCGTFYYYEPNSAFLLATDKLLIAPTKFVAAMYLFNNHYRDIPREKLEDLEVAVKFYRYRGHLGPYKLKSYVDSAKYSRVAGEELLIEEMLNGSFAEGFTTLSQDSMRRLYASEDLFDQPLCEAARSINIPVILLTCMIGKSRVVSELLDTRSRRDSYESIIVDSRYLNYHKLQRTQYNDIEQGLAEDYPVLFQDKSDEEMKE